MATVLKSKQFTDGINTAKVEVFNWEDVATRARSYIASVRQQAQEIVQQAQDEAVRIRKAAQEEGRVAGQDDVVSAAENLASQLSNQRIQSATQTVRRLSDELEEATQQWLRQWQHETIPLAVAIAERLVRRQLEIDPTILLQWLQDSVRLVQGSQSVQLRMHSSDIQVLGDSLTQLLDELGARVKIELVSDDTVARHGLTLRSSELFIDQQLHAQLERLREELL